MVVFFKLQINSYTSVPLWGADGGLYGYYAKEILNGASLPFDPEHMPGFLLAFFAFFTGLDKAIFYLPVFLSSLTVFPVIAIGYIYGVIEVGFFASILGSLSFAYFSRNFGGFYDTDCLNLFFSLSILASLIYSVEKDKKTGLILSMFFSVLFFFWYHSSFLIIFSLYFAYALYITVINKKFSLLFVILLISLIFYYLGYFHRAYDYLVKPEVVYVDGMVLKNTLSTVLEAKPISLDKFIRFIAVNKIVFILLSVGYLFFLYKKRSFFLSLPLMVVSLISLKAGARFIEYGSYILPFGIYLFYRYKPVFYIVSLVLIVFYSKKDIHFRPAPLMDKSDVFLLKKLNTSKNDFIITWWDYGWNLWYYTNANTIIDNGKHLENNFVVSKIFFTPLNDVSKTIKYYMQYCPNRYCKILTNIKNNHLTKTSGNVYILFKRRLIKILPTILLFSKTDPFTGKKTGEYYLQVFRINKKVKNLYVTDNSKIKIDIKHKIFTIKNKKYNLKDLKIISSSFGKSDFYFKIDKFYFIKYKSYLIVCNERVFNSFIIQAYILKNIPKDMKIVFNNKDLMILKLDSI